MDRTKCPGDSVWSRALLREVRNYSLPDGTLPPSLATQVIQAWAMSGSLMKFLRQIGIEVGWDGCTPKIISQEHISVKLMYKRLYQVVARSMSYTTKRLPDDHVLKTCWLTILEHLQFLSELELPPPNLLTPAKELSEGLLEGWLAEQVRIRRAEEKRKLAQMVGIENRSAAWDEKYGPIFDMMVKVVHGLVKSEACEETDSEYWMGDLSMVETLRRDIKEEMLQNMDMEDGDDG